MFTPHELETLKFKRSAFGYSIDAVEEFMEKLCADYSQLYKDNATLSKKLTVVVEKMEEYRESEESFRNAVVQAQKVSDSLIKDTKNRSEIMIRDAEIRADKVIAAAKAKVNEEREYFEDIKNEVYSFKAEILNKYAEHIKLIETLPDPAIGEVKTVDVPTVEIEETEKNISEQDVTDQIEQTIIPENDDETSTDVADTVKFSIYGNKSILDETGNVKTLNDAPIQNDKTSENTDNKKKGSNLLDELFGKK